MASEALRLYRAILKKGKQLLHTDKTYFRKLVRLEFEKGKEATTNSEKLFQLEVRYKHVWLNWAIPLNNYTPLLMTKNVVQRGSNGNDLGGCSIAVRCVQRGSMAMS